MPNVGEIILCTLIILVFFPNYFGLAERWATLPCSGTRLQSDLPFPGKVGC